MWCSSWSSSWPSSLSPFSAASCPSCVPAAAASGVASPANTPQNKRPRRRLLNGEYGDLVILYEAVALPFRSQGHHGSLSLKTTDGM